MDRKKELADAKAEQKAKLDEKKDLEKDIREKTRTAESEKADFKKMEEQKTRLETQQKQVQREVDGIQITEAKLEELQQRRSRLEPEVEGKKDRLDKINHKVNQFKWCGYERRNMPQGFDHGGVLGVMVDMIDVHPDFHVAVDSSGGGALNSVICRTSRQAALIVKHGRLRRKTNFYPLDRFEGNRGLSNEQIQRAKQLGRCWGIDEVLTIKQGREAVGPVLQTILGRQIYCEDDKTAQLIMEKLNVNTVSKSGSIYRTTGEISGGQKLQKGILQLRAIQESVQK